MSPSKNVQRTPEEQAARDQEDVSAQAEMKTLEDGDSVPTDPADWPTGKAKFLTFGNESDEAYGDGPTGMLGPAGLELNSDGSKTVRGEERAREAAAALATGPDEPATARPGGLFGFLRRSSKG